VPVTQPPLAPPAKRRNPIAIIALAVIALVAVCIGGIVVFRAVAGSKPVVADNGNPVIITSTDPNPPAPGQNDYHTPVPADFKLDIKILSRECFGSAGCNVAFRVTLAKMGNYVLDPDREYEITYEVRGGDEVKVNTMTITGDQYSDDDEQLIGTKSSKSKLTAVIMSVDLH